MTTITVTLEDELARQLDDASMRAGMTSSDIIRRALAEFFAKRPEPGRDALAGMFDFGEDDFAEKSEDVLHSLAQAKGAWTTKSRFTLLPE